MTFTRKSKLLLLNSFSVLLDLSWEEGSTILMLGGASLTPASWYKLNTDGSSLSNPGMAGGGGLIRDDNRNWVKDFPCSIGVTTSVEVELWALGDGLILCVNLNLLAVEIEVEEFNSNLYHASLIMDCRTLISQIPQVKMKHCFREANICADLLARKGSSSNQGHFLFHSPPVDLSFSASFLLYWVVL